VRSTPARSWRPASVAVDDVLDPIAEIAGRLLGLAHRPVDLALVAEALVVGPVAGGFLGAALDLVLVLHGARLPGRPRPETPSPTARGRRGRGWAPSSPAGERRHGARAGRRVVRPDDRRVQLVAGPVGLVERLVDHHDPVDATELVGLVVVGRLVVEPP